MLPGEYNGRGQPPSVIQYTLIDSLLCTIILGLLHGSPSPTHFLRGTLKVAISCLLKPQGKLLFPTHISHTIHPQLNLLPQGIW